MKVKWKLLFGAGIVLLTLTVVAIRAYPKQTVWTGEYLEIYEGRSYTKEYDIIPAETNPDWVKAFQEAGVIAFAGSLLLIIIGGTKLRGD
jgi:hypothetical protein